MNGLNTLRPTDRRPASTLGTRSKPPAPRPQAAPGHADHSGFWGLLTSAPWELPFLLPRSDTLCYADRGTGSLRAHLLRCWSCPKGAPHPVPPRPPPSSMRPAPVCRGPDGSPHPLPVIPPCPLHTQRCNQSSKDRVLKNVTQTKLLLLFWLKSSMDR